MPKVETVSEEQGRAILPDLVALLMDVVNGGSSVGFIPPLTYNTAEEYWLETLSEVSKGARVLLVSREEGEVAGSVQLALATKQNGLHRAEVQKLLVRTRFRNRGMARALMGEVEEAARAAGRTLLVLDTEQGSIAETLYARLGYTRAGVIPNYARDATGSLHATVVFYRMI